MVFEPPPNSAGQVQSLTAPVQMPEQNVYPIGKIVENGLKGLEGILEEFGPLAKEERKAKLAQAMYLRMAYEAGQKGDHRMLDAIHGHQRQTLTPYEIYKRNEAAARGRRAGQGPKAPSDAARRIAAQRLLREKAARDFMKIQQLKKQAAPPPATTGGTETMASPPNSYQGVVGETPEAGGGH